MKCTIDPGKERRSINFIDNICYSHVTDLEGKPLDLYLSLILCWPVAKLSPATL